ncbi:MAG TPA: hypothetical protein VF484_07185 [Candidatus Limnocylindrales bacterium]
MAPSRSAGQALLAFGAVGLVLLLAAAILAVATLGSLSATTADLARGRDQLMAMIAPASASLRSSAAAARNASTSLTQSATAARDGSALMTQLAGSLDQMATLSDLSILGQQPFASAGASFRDTAAKSRTLSTSLETTATSIDTNVRDTAQVSTSLDALASQLDALQADLSTAPATPAAWTWVALDVVVIGLLGWLAVIALVALRIGWRWTRTG